MPQIWLLGWLTILTGLQSTQQTGMKMMQMTPETPMTPMKPVSIQTKIEMVSNSAIGTAHNGQVCSTWGNFHFSTFDGDFFQLPYTCNYILTTMCDSTQSEFNIQMRRENIGERPEITAFTIKLGGIVIMLQQGNITVNNKALIIPGYYSGIRIERMTNYIKIQSKLGLTVFWDEHNALSIEISKNYRNQTCGLCGDFNGILENEFIENGQLLTPEEFGYKWKMDLPTETCAQTEIYPKDNCQKQTNTCQRLLYHPAFESCHNLLPTNVYLEACLEDLCQCNSSRDSCLCDTLSEFSRQCAHAGGTPASWRSHKFCGITCPLNMVHSECGSPCTDTCSNQEGLQLCADHCVDGCVCPPGTVLDDINNTGCIPVDECPCTHNGKTYSPGQSFTRTCEDCVCSDGRWNCITLDCSGTCSLLGGSHVITYDGKAYSFHGNCDYVLSKHNSSDMTVFVHLAQCGVSESETCLTSVKFIISDYPVTITSTGNVFLNDVATKLPVVTNQVKLFKPSTFFIIAQTPSIQIIVQLVPVMQVYLEVSSKQKGTLSGLCGNFNDKQADDFKAKSGLIEGTATTFASTWKTALCQDFSTSLNDPCSMSVEKEMYAMEWCQMLRDPAGAFAPCHIEINPKDYIKRCKYDACVCAHSEDCMCAAVSSYVHACAARGVMLKGWRDIICKTFTQNCPGNMEYSYNQTSCRKSCRSLSEIDHTCYLPYTPVDGCGCAKNTYLNDMGECVPSSDCPCYVNNEIVAPMQVISKAGSTCTCRHGTLQCTGPKEITTCTAPMVYFNCSQAEPGQKGTECQNICETLDSNPCMSTQCKSGCVCPDGLLADGQGGCVTKEQCPCFHNGAFYQPGETVKSDCNNCTCKNRKWICTKKECNKICTIYGDSHYISFDGRRYTFNGNCEYTLAQDYCGNSNKGSFRIITENIPCGTTGTTCAKSIKIFLGNKQLLLSEENIKSVQYDNSTVIPYKIHSVGIYLVIEAENSLTLIWDKKTSLMVKLGPSFKGEVCGLCGNYDGDWNNDFMTRGGEAVVEPAEFGNSWRVSATCPEASGVLSPCSMRPYRQAWAIRQCSILKSEVFRKCHTEVDPTQYYEACVQDTCACDAGGDCECFCTAVAAYAAECSGKGVCIMWRSPTICPLFCDYYNLNEGCEWHYKPCGQSCMKTCKNPTGVCYSEIPPLEGCFPQCPSDRPYLEEATMKCVARKECGCYDDESNTHYSVGESIPTTLNCNKCYCTAQGPSCSYSKTDCYCEYNGQKYETGQIIYHTTDGDGTCISARCEQNGTIIRKMDPCTTTPTPTPTSTPTPTPTMSATIFNFTSTMETSSTTTQPPVSSTTIPGTTVTTVISSTTTETVSTPTVETSSTTTQPPVSSTTIPGTTVTTVIPPTTTETVSTPTVETLSTTTQPPVSSTTIPGTTSHHVITGGTRSTQPQCSCQYMGHQFLNGSVMYNETDGTGWCFIAYCDSECNVYKQSVPCLTTPTTPSTLTTPSTTFSTKHPPITSTPSIPKDCTYLNPPRKNGESWKKDCKDEICTDGSVISKPVQCVNSDLPVPVCENTLPPVKVYDETRCCYHYECQCKCLGWGDPHYVTFDGKYYAFQGNCTYVLVQEIIKKYNFSVHIKNYMCDTVQNLACPDYLTVYYKSYKIDLKQTRNPTVNKIYVNDVAKSNVYSNADFTITTTGIAMTLDIPAIQAQVTFKGMNFVVNLPFSLFHNNTEGQCGKCDNNTSNDCRLPNGATAESCEVMAPKWQVNKTECPNPPPPPTKTPTAKPCQPAICNIIFNKVFEKCHKLLNPEISYKACVYDVCHMQNATGCSSLENYAHMCADESICVDWRGLTNGMCAPNCPSNKVYMACGPKVEGTCNSRFNEKFVNCESSECLQNFQEGCFCPNGTTLFNTVSNICTAFCGCIGSDGLPKQPGEKWRSQCNDCTCSKESMGPVCEPVLCPKPESCTIAGYELQTVDCCQKCVCNSTLCPEAFVVCPAGFHPVQNKTNSDCCTTFSCEPKYVCVFNETEYLPGDKVPSDSCEVCVCGSTVNPSTSLLNTECTPMSCNKTCPMGFSYEAVPGQCCGICVQEQCVYNNAGPPSTIITIEVGQSWTDQNEPCVTINCTKVNDAFVLVKIPPSCPEYNPEVCIPGTEQTTANGCCKTCQQQNCHVLKNSTYLEVDNCISINPVEITSCAGSCNTSSIYSMAANTMMHHCSCCQELKTSSIEVQLRCANNRLKPYTYTHIEQCGCHITECSDSKESG